MKYTLILAAALCFTSCSKDKSSPGLPKYNWQCNHAYYAIKTADTANYSGGTPFWQKTWTDTLLQKDTAFQRIYMYSKANWIGEDSFILLRASPDTFAAYGRYVTCNKY